MTKWVVDGNQTVHVSICGGVRGTAMKYLPQRRVFDAAGKPSLADVPDVDAMIEHLARPDASGGMVTHSGPTMLVACPVCIS